MSGQMLTFVMLVLQSWIYGSVALNVCSASDPALTSFLTRFFAGASNSFTKETPVSVSISFNASNISLATSIEPTLPMRSPITSEVEQPTIQSSSFLKKDLDFSSSNNGMFGKYFSF